jgi:hypothetical protein
MDTDNNRGNQEIIEVFPQIGANLRKLLPYGHNERHSLCVYVPARSQVKQSQEGEA